jgi:hypothetical protein
MYVCMYRIIDITSSWKTYQYSCKYVCARPVNVCLYVCNTDPIQSGGVVLHASSELVEQLWRVSPGVGRLPGARGSQRAGPLQPGAGE